jgi:hypothetical protein
MCCVPDLGTRVHGKNFFKWQVGLVKLVRLFNISQIASKLCFWNIYKGGWLSGRYRKA